MKQTDTGSGHGRIIVALMALALFAGFEPPHVPAQAGSVGPQLRRIPETLTALYDARAGVLTTESVTVFGRQVDFGIGFSTGASGNYDARRLSGPTGAVLEYQLINPGADGQVIKDLNAAGGASTLIYGSIRGGGSAPREESFPFALISPQGQYLPAGDYTDTVMVRLYGGNPAQGNPLEEEPMLLILNVPAMVAISVVNRGQPFEAAFPDPFPLDFGVLEQGRHEEVDVIVQTNVNYSLTVTSPNSGVMVLKDLPDEGSVVPYTMRVNGTVRGLSGGSAEIATGSPTSAGGDRYNLFFEIGDTREAVSGTYEDNLTVTVTAQ
ncbi:MAG: hypothetical protein EA427_01880 [Spirochaetaceae bacterium]|nr:MAG: hypothetical protein EA427_01880 [Spirochaetaceae bacterium]